MAASLKNQVSVIGVGCIKFGDNFDQGYEEMAVDAAFAAFHDGCIVPEEIDAAWLGTYSPAQGHGKAAVSLGDALRLYNKAISRVENFCAMGTDAFRHAVLAVASGMSDTTLVLGVGKHKDRPGRGLDREGIHPYYDDGSAAPGLFALAATRYMRTFGLKRETLAKVAVKNHFDGSLNAKAHLRKKVTAETVLSAPIVAYPFGLYGCCPTTAGAAAAVVCRADLAQKYRPDHVPVKGVGLAATCGRPFRDPTYDYLGFRAAQHAAAQAYAMAGITDPLKEIDVAEGHDCFTWPELTNYEDLGFIQKGEGARLIEEGRTALDGDIPVNPSGGL